MCIRSNTQFLTVKVQYSTQYASAYAIRMLVHRELCLLSNVLCIKEICFEELSNRLAVWKKRHICTNVAFK